MRTLNGLALNHLQTYVGLAYHAYRAILLLFQALLISSFDHLIILLLYRNSILFQIYTDTKFVEKDVKK
jgi:hypothetical protein